MLLAAGLLTACSEYESQAPAQGDMTTLRINVYTPSSNSYTTRAEDTDPATDPERTMHDLKVWAFLSSQTGGDAVAVGYAFKSDLNQANEYQWLEMGLPKSVINQKLDFYAIANATGTGFEEVTALGYYPTRSAIESAKFTAFGTTNAVTGAVPKSGLPASRILKGVTPVTALESTPENPNRLSITLLRAVAKFRFFFAKPEGFDGQITKIELNENVLPSSELMMPAASTDNDVLPHTKAVTLPTGATMTSSTLTYATPLTNITALADANALESYVKTTDETFTTYVNRLANNLTEYTAGLTYIRESDAPLTGKIYYKIGGTDTEEKSVDFVLQTEDMEDHGTDGTVHNCFPRNHYSVVYGYFKGGKLEVKPLLQPWEWEEDHQVEMESKGEILISILGDKGKQSYKVFDPTPNDGVFPSNINWNNAYVGVYYGEETDEENPLFGQPLYSPLLHLKTKFSQPLTLHNTNPGFEFVKVTIGEHGARSFEHMDEITIPAWTEGTEEEPNPAIDTYFFVVPKTELSDAAIDVNNLPAERINKLYLLDENGYKLPVNPSFMPGPNNNEIWFFYMNSLDAYHNLNDYQ